MLVFVDMNRHVMPSPPTLHRTQMMPHSARALDGRSCSVLTAITTFPDRSRTTFSSITAKVLIRRELRRYGVDVRSIMQPTYSLAAKDPADVLIHGMLELLDEYERLTIALHLRLRRLQKAKQRGNRASGLL
ncbi:MAG: hypothetical protein QME77_07925 [bacterium]|nr:hypothetical protein [bacterium]